MSERQRASRTTTRKPATAEVGFGVVLRERRLAAGLTQADLEAMTGVDRSFISQLETGQKQACLKTVIQLAAQLGLSPGELVDEAVGRMDRKELSKLRSPM